ncbi:hypoxanthine phosphoribosyltransferase [Christensenellaceae bacterium OttesenSCG-928-L17]|nr:hypoxanthine phosphoribosyltransferase [Christensenellaceae bacterium OttesenSCG-928-L17]
MSGFLHEDIAEVLLREDEIHARVRELGKQISKDYAGKSVLLVCILKGAVVFFSDLARSLDIPCKMDFMAISSYGDGTKTSGIVRIAKDVDTSLTDQHVLIVEDIMDSGLTLNHLRKLLQARNPKSMRIVCLLDKPDRRECEITPDYCGFSIPNKFVVGYGLDYGGHYRHLPYVGVLKPEVYAE